MKTSRGRDLERALGLLFSALLGCAAPGSTEGADGSHTEQRAELTCATFERGAFGGVEDARVAWDPLDASKATTNYGQAPLLAAGGVGLGAERALIKFDLSVIPVGSPVVSATLSLHKGTAVGSGVATVHRITQPWSEASVTWASFASAFDSNPVAKLDPFVSGPLWQVNVASLVASWVDGKVANEGLLVDLPKTGRIRFGASDASTAVVHPELTICYSPATCFDGVQNQGEVGTDCGGPCAKCACTSPAPFLAGVADGYSTANGAEAPLASSTLDAHINGIYPLQYTPASRDFDVSQPNRWFAHTFAALTPSSGAAICGATLTIGVQPGGGNDTMGLWFVDANGASKPWTQPLSSLGLTLGAPQTLTLDLAALPGGVDLLPQLNAAGFLDVIVQDDTAVDHLDLTLTHCCDYCAGASFCTPSLCYSPSAPISEALCGCALADASCGMGSCVGTAYCEGGACANPACFDPWDAVSQILCGGAVATPQVVPRPAQVLSDPNPVGSYGADFGSSRGSGYWPTNKIVRKCGKIFAGWQGYDPSQSPSYRVFVSQGDVGSGAWTSTVALGDPLYTMDDHGAPAMTIDSAGYLHVLYGPHHNPLLETTSLQPCDATAFLPPTALTGLGVDATLPSLVRDSADTLHVVYRESWLLKYARKVGGVWDPPVTLATTGYGNYSVYHGSIAVGSDDSLHVAYNLYSSAVGGAQIWGYLRSTDGGTTWEDSFGIPISSLPVDGASPSDANRFVESSPTIDTRISNITVDGANEPWITVIYVHPNASQVDTKLWHRSGGVWTSTSLSASLPNGLRMSGATVTFDAQGVLYVAGETLSPTDASSTAPWFDGATKEVVLLTQVNNQPFQVQSLTTPDPTRARLHASIERPTTPEPIDVPSLLYTDGGAWLGTSDIVFIGLYKQ